MLYQKEIDDSVLIQFIILYTLNNADLALSYNDLLNLVMDNCNISYTELQLALDNLVVTGHIRTFRDDPKTQKYIITQKGAYAGNFFMKHIPVYIREPINDALKELFREERRKNAVRGEISVAARGEYTAECSLYDDDNVCLMELSLYLGSKQQAKKAVRYFKEHSDIVYEKILNAFAEEKESTDE